MTLRCPECRTRRATYQSMQAHIKESGHKLCNCSGGGVLHYPHRPGTRYCDHHPWAGLHRAMKYGDLTDTEIEDIAIDIALQWTKPLPLKSSSECPF